MTVCIAIACEAGTNSEKPKLVLVMDTMLSWDISSSEVTLKSSRLRKNWHAMFAGMDVSLVDVVMGHARTDLKELQEANDTAIARVMVNSYQEVRRKQIEDIYLSSFSWTIEKFLRDGKKLLQPSQHAYLFDKIQRFDLNCAFLVSGFSPKAKAQTIFHVENPGVLRPAQPKGYAAIGTGAINALGYLERREQASWVTLPTSIYNGIAAKCLAEKALGVGKETVVIVTEKGEEQAKFVRAETVNEIRRMWEIEESPIRPQNLEQRITKLLENGFEIPSS